LTGTLGGFWVMCLLMMPTLPIPENRSSNVGLTMLVFAFSL
jgi:hypothetical protein